MSKLQYQDENDEELHDFFYQVQQATYRLDMQDLGLAMVSPDEDLCASTAIFQAVQTGTWRSLRHG